MLLRTIDSVALLDYPDFECVVVINNTPDPAFWEPIYFHSGARATRKFNAIACSVFVTKEERALVGEQRSMVASRCRVVPNIGWQLVLE